MDSRGWGWTASEIRQVQLTEWLADEAEAPNVYVSVELFYEGRPDQRENDSGVANADLKLLEERGLIINGSGLGSMDTLAAMIAPSGRNYLEGLRSSRADKAKRRIACRDAMVAWLYSVDAINTRNQPVRQQMLSMPKYGMWLAAPFDDTDLADASAWLREQGLARGVTAWGDPGLLRLYLTSDGVSCAELFDFHTTRYLERHMQQNIGHTVNVHGNSGQIQVGSDNAHQVQHIGTNAEHLRELINSLAERVGQVMPDADDLAAEHNAALAAAEDGAVDQSAIQRFGTWALSIVSKGTSTALVLGVSTAVTDMLHEAARIAGQLA